MKKITPIVLALFTAAASTAQVTVDSVLGPQELAILPFDYAQDGSETPVSHIDSGMFAAPNSIKAFFDEISYGKMSLQGTTYTYRTNQPPLFGTGYTNCYPTDQTLVNQPDVDYSIIDNIVMFVHDTASKSCAAGLSSFSKLPFSTDDGNFNFRRSGFRTQFYFPNDFSGTVSSTVAHELMHSFGNSFHSNAYVQDSGQWTVQGYGNVFDILGLRSQASHPCSMIKHKLGWLTNQEVHTVTHSDTFRIYPLEQTLPGQTQALILELTNQLDLQPNDTFKFDRLYLEYRGLTGFDSRSSRMRRVRLKDNSYYPNDSVHGLSIIGVDCSYGGDCRPMLIDMHPAPIGGVGASYFPHEASDAPLRLGESYQVAGNGIDIEVIQVSEGNYIDVAITLPGAGLRDRSGLEIKSYPRPVSHLLHLDNPSGSPLDYVFYNTLGQPVLKGSTTDQIRVSGLPEGVYVLKLLDHSTDEVAAQRIVIRRN